MSLKTLISRIFGQPDRAAKPPAGSSKRAARYWITNPYHAVSIVPTPAQACAAVKSLAGRRSLSTEAPPIPLPGCDALVCRCAYKHHDDRRSARRRSADRGIESYRGQKGDERRQSRGRRSIDYG